MIFAPIFAVAENAQQGETRFVLLRAFSLLQ
jgi:hypothetical protein